MSERSSALRIWPGVRCANTAGPYCAVVTPAPPIFLSASATAVRVGAIALCAAASDCPGVWPAVRCGENDAGTFSQIETAVVCAGLSLATFAARLGVSLPYAL